MPHPHLWGAYLNMEPVASTVDRISGLAQSVEKRIRAAFRKQEEDGSVSPDPNAADPIEILKRLQRESFSDLMKLRDRQDKFERLLASSRSRKGNLFQEARTRVTGVIDVVGALFFAGADGQQTVDSLMKAGVSTGIESRFSFETVVRQKDSVIAELVASNRMLSLQDNLPSSSLALSKVIYTANINDWLSVVTSPLGPQCKDLGPYSSSLQGSGSGLSTPGPPLFSRYHGCAAGLNLKGKSFAAALAELVSEFDLHSDPARSFLATFGQFSCQLFEDTKVTLSGLWEIPRSPFRKMKIGALSVPIFSARLRHSNAFVRQSNQGMTCKPKETLSGGSIAVMLDAEFDEFTRVGAWIQMQKTSPNYLQWAVSLSDAPEGEFGWGFRVGGSVEGHINRVHLEGFLNFNLGERFSLQPGLVYAMDQRNRKPVLMIRSNWSI